MARRKTGNPRHWERMPNTYARTTDVWTTRYYQRKVDPLFNLLGLNPASDDFHKKEGGSPFLKNVRFMGEREPEQRAQVMSRKGARFMGTIGEDRFPRAMSLGTSYLEVYEGKAIEFVMLHNKLLTGLSMRFQNHDDAKGYIKITVRRFSDREELGNAVIDPEAIGRENYTHHIVRLIQAVQDTQVRVRIELVDDLSADELETPRRQRRKVRILAVNEGNHERALYEVPNNNDALREIPYSWEQEPNIPLTGVMVNDWQPIPRNHPFTAQGKKFDAFPVRQSGMVVLYKRDLETGDISELSSQLHVDTQAVRFAQAEGFLYYVDGFSPLKRVNLTTWAVEDAIPQAGDITLPGVNPETLKAKEGASLIWKLNNRLYLSGFKDSPNLVIQSLIDDTKPRFDQFDASGRFFSPDESPESSAASPITAFADINDYLVVFRVDGISLYDRGGSTIYEDTRQITPEGSKIGVLNQEAVAQGKGNIYFYNQVEGVCRFGGNIYRVISGDIDPLIRRIKHKDKVFLMYNNQRLRMYHSYESEQADSCFYYYADLEGRLPWYRDTNTPVCSAYADDMTGEIHAVHSQVATLMTVDSDFKDFDSLIEMEYHTAYRVPPTSRPEGEIVIKRLHLHELADSEHSTYMGVDMDYQDIPAVWRKRITPGPKPERNPDAVFQPEAEGGITPVSIHTLIRGRMYQVRFKRYCWNETAEVLGITMEYGTKQAI